MKKIILIILLFAVLITLGITIYFNKVLLPVKAKSFILEKIELYTSCRTEIDRLSFNPIKGFILENISLSKRDEEKDKLIFIERASVNLLVLPAFKDKKIVVPFKINIFNPVIDITRLKDKKIDIP